CVDQRRRAVPDALEHYRHGPDLRHGAQAVPHGRVTMIAVGRRHTLARIGLTLIGASTAATPTPAAAQCSAFASAGSPASRGLAYSDTSRAPSPVMTWPPLIIEGAP